MEVEDFVGPDDWSKAVEVNKIRIEKLYKTLPWSKLPLAEKRRIILKEQNVRYLKCRLNEWMGQPLVLELHHVDGDKCNNARGNL